uniref:Uncharacterized protein n=1 Tax=Desulfovibrio sp. U5L TaxID=596152 RepID=I2Q2N2_9BACT
MAVYKRCSKQVIVGQEGEPIDINVLAVKCVMDLMGVRDQDECLEKVQLLAGIIIDEQTGERERKREKRAGQG